jgi:hypothetical protein
MQREQSTSQLVRELAGVRGTGFDMTASPQEVETETLASLRTATETLTAKARKERPIGGSFWPSPRPSPRRRAGLKPGETAALDKI